MILSKLTVSSQSDHPILQYNPHDTLSSHRSYRGHIIGQSQSNRAMWGGVGSGNVVM